MKRTLFVVSILSAMSGSAMAGGFDGPFVQLGIAGSSASSALGGGTTFDSTTTQRGANGMLAAGYSQSVGVKGFNLAAGLFSVMGNQNAGDPSWNSVQNSVTQNAIAQNRLKNTFGISVEPGWNVSKDALGYLKLAWIRSQFNMSGSYSQSDGFRSSWDYTQNINGFGYGLGGKYVFTENIYVTIDLMGVSYRSTSYGNSIGGGNVSNSQTLGFVGIGYKF